jgi:hypothetical protein
VITLDLFTMDFLDPEEAEESELAGLDEFADEPQCALRRDGSCELAGSRYCESLCPHTSDA